MASEEEVTTVDDGERREKVPQPLELHDERPHHVGHFADHHVLPIQRNSLLGPIAGPGDDLESIDHRKLMVHQSRRSVDRRTVEL